MDIQRLKTFRELEVRGTMAAVSEAIGISPSAVSQQISLLEEELDTVLLERRGRGVVITPAGHVLIKHANRMLSVIEDARTELAEINRRVTGTLSIGSFSSIAAWLLPGVLRELQERFPELLVLTSEMEPHVSLTALRSWQCDIAIVDDLSLTGDLVPEGMSLQPIYEDEIVVLLHREHRLAKKVQVELADLQQEFWVMDATANTFSEAIYSMCSAIGFQPRIIAQYDSIDVISAMVANRCGITVIPRIRAMGCAKELVAVKLAPAVKRSVLLATRQGELRRPTLSIVFEALQRHALAIPPAKNGDGPSTKSPRHRALR